MLRLLSFMSCVGAVKENRHGNTTATTRRRPCRHPGGYSRAVAGRSQPWCPERSDHSGIAWI